MITINENIRHKLLALQTLARKVSHDTNNYYGVIQGYLSLLEMRIEADEHLRELLSPMREAIDEGVALNRQLAALYRPAPPMISAVNPAELVPEVCRVFADEHDYPVKVEIENDPGVAELDGEALRKVIRNLCLLLKATRTGPARIHIGIAVLDRDAVGEMIFDSEPGDYIRLQTTLSLEGYPQREETEFLNPFTTGLDGRDDPGAVDILAGVQSHGGNLDVRLEKGRVELNLYFPLRGV